MITNEDLRIENTSYTNKDFAQVYPELVDAVKQLTDKWDPELTNESDPGVVLLKLAAFVADKNNFNIDKNILEQFPVSVTQEINARRIYDDLGYNMKYYNSATSKLSFKYLAGNATIDEDTTPGQTYTIKAFDSSVKTSENIVYTLLTDAEFSKDQKLVTGIEAIQGQLTCLNVSSTASAADETTKIHIYNLDDNNRVYFPDRYVAENGIYINKIYSNTGSGEYWEKVDNLNDIETGTKCYKFGFDSSKNLPYLEFPSDIADLIGDGIEVWYIITDGLNGYAKNGSLTEFNSILLLDKNNNQITDLTVDEYALSNSESIGARDPENLTQAYSNFKKVIGTFNTLLSKRDYSNGIYSYEDNNGDVLVSAIQASDIKSDPNVATQVLTRDSGGLSYYKTTSNLSGTTLTANSIILHGTEKASNNLTTKNAYDSTYKLLNNVDLRNIDDALTERKTLVHELALPKAGTTIDGSHLNMIQNRYELKVNVTTTYKVNEYEQSIVLSNIKKALYNAFNARNIDFGEEIPYDEIVRVIQESDSRVKYVFVETPEITPYMIYQLKDTSNELVTKELIFDPLNTNNTVSGNIDFSAKILINNILAGRVSYLLDDTQFNYDFNQKSFATQDKVHDLTANFTISANTSTTLQPNESIQVLQDSFITKITYPAYIWYSLELNNDSKVITAGSTYRLGDNENLYIFYTDSEDVKQYIVYPKGTLIRPKGFDLKDTYTVGQGAGESKSPAKWVDFVNKKANSYQTEGYTPMYSLGTNESIEYVVRNESKLTDRYQQCFWYIKPKADNLKGDLKFTNGKYILEEGEFFIYPNEDMTSLVIMSSGTKLEYAGGNLEKAINNYIDLDELDDTVDSEDIATFERAFKWQTVDFTTNNMTLVEQSVTTFIEDDAIKSDVALSNAWTSFTNGQEIKDLNTGESTTATAINNMVARTVLSIIGSRNTPQLLNAGETLVVNYTNPSDPTSTLSTTLSAGKYFQLNQDVDLYNYAFLGTPVIEETENGFVIKDDEFTYDYNILSYQLKTSSEMDANAFLKTVKEGGKNARGEYIFTSSTATTISFSDIPTGTKVNVFDSDNYASEPNPTSVIYPKGSTVSIKANTTYYISTPKVLDYNEVFGTSYMLSAYSQHVKEDIDARGDFDKLAPLNEAKLITAYDTFGAYWFFDKNNIYNQFTLAKIDFDNSEFRIVGASKK